MTAENHPSDIELAAFAAGTRDDARRMAIATHLRGCSRCHAFVRAMEHVGGVVLEGLPPAALAGGSLAAVMARLDSPAPASRTPGGGPSERGGVFGAPGGFSPRWFGHGRRTARGKRIRNGLANAALVTLSLGITYLAAEYAFFRHGLPYVSMNLRPHLPDRADFYLQNSKADHVPRDYIALIGDSYAQGMGDWLLSVGGKNDQPYHSANVVRELTGKDVVSFGRAAAGSAEAMVLRVTRILGDSYCYLFPPIERPKRFFIYFYGGNDIYDNHRLMQRALKKGDSDPGASVDRFLEQEYGSVSPWRCHGHLGDMIYRMARFLIRDYFAQHRTIDLPPTSNKVLIANKATGTPELQTPPVNLTESQIDEGVLVYERALAWLRRNFPDVPTTVVYIPAPAATYRHAGPEVVAKDVYLPEQSKASGREVIVDGPVFQVSSVYDHSQRVCEKIRGATLKSGVSFIDARPAFRREAARQPIHGPRDWNHPNETGYRLLGSLVANHVDDSPKYACDNTWPS
jgi:GDSL-like Lipase/Acylhydrolase family